MYEGKISIAVVGNGKSRLPAGSTLEVSPGVHVPHPHAEVNVAGAPDPRRGETSAVTEDLEGNQRALADEVKTTAEDLPEDEAIVDDDGDHGEADGEEAAQN